jgi:four helix bundle protein
MKNYDDLKQRTRKFALDVIRLMETLPNDDTSRILKRQLIDSGTSVGANYRSASRAKSAADFVSRMGWVEQEADESGYWLDLLVAAGKLKQSAAAPLFQEAGELTAIAVASINTARKSGVR